jgi:hypothetical protein
VSIYPARRTNLLTTSDEMLLQGFYGEQREQRRAHLEEARRQQREEQLKEQQYRDSERRRLDNLSRREVLAHNLGLGVKAEDIAALEEVGAA